MKKVKQNEKTKQCANPKCTIVNFNTKSEKKRFCSIYCKNQAAYNYLNVKYSWYQYVMKSLRKNIKILEYLNSRGVINIMHNELKRLGFSFDIALTTFVDPIGGRIFRYENLTLRQISQNEYELLKLNYNAAS
jgi:hypothetical protein